MTLRAGPKRGTGRANRSGRAIRYHQRNGCIYSRGVTVAWQLVEHAVMYGPGVHAPHRNYILESDDATVKRADG